MWVKKSESKLIDELQKANQLESKIKLKKTLNVGVWTFLFAFTIKILISITLGVDYYSDIPSPSNVIGFSEIPDYLPVFISTGLYWSIGFMLFRFFSPNLFKNKSTSEICDSCFTIRNFNKKKSCKCGGVYYPLTNYEWVEKKKDNLMDNMDWINKYKIEKRNANNGQNA